MLDCIDIKASYRDIIILKKINFAVRRGEFIGVIGPNGAGKTTLIKIITGVKLPLSGRIILDGKDIAELKRKEIARKMAVVPQSSFIPPLFTVEDVVTVGRYAHRVKKITESAIDMDAVTEAMRKTGTEHFRNRFANELSGGERQEVMIARALAQNPALLVLDEPTANLDLLHQIRILHLINQLVRENDLTVVMVIHDLNLAARFCTRLLLLNDGNVLASGKPETVLTSDNLATAYGVNALVNYNEVICAHQVTIIDCIDQKGVYHKECL